MAKRHARLNARRWARVRRTVLDRDNWRCRNCHRYGNECDHIDRDPRIDPYEMDNLQTLCRACHIEKTRCENRRPLTPAEAEWAAFVQELLDATPDPAQVDGERTDLEGA